VLTHSRANGENGRYNTLDDGQKWSELLHITEKHLKKHKENKEKTSKGEDEIRKGGESLSWP
jgi:hypothetical protein